MAEYLSVRRHQHQHLQIDDILSSLLSFLVQGALSSPNLPPQPQATLILFPYRLPIRLEHQSANRAIIQRPRQPSPSTASKMPCSTLSTTPPPSPSSNGPISTTFPLFVTTTCPYSTSSSPVHPSSSNHRTLHRRRIILAHSLPNQTVTPCFAPSKTMSTSGILPSRAISLTKSV